MKEDLEQLSFDFNLKLPPNNIEEINKVLPYSPAKVPDDEFTCKPSLKYIPTVDEIIRMLEKGALRVSMHEFLSDVFECSAIAVSNKFDKTHYDEREKRYLQIIKKYDKDERILLADIFAKIYVILSQQIYGEVGFNDYLGQIYMRSETSNKKSGQFFTPYSVSSLCAEVTINETMVNEHIEQDRILTLNEPTCGSGGMILAAADVLYNKYHFNISRNLVVECSDIDPRCVHMCYLQIGLAGIPAVIYHQNTLTLQTWDRWETPAYIMQYARFKDLFRR